MAKTVGTQGIMTKTVMIVGGIIVVALGGFLLIPIKGKTGIQRIKGWFSKDGEEQA